MAANWAERVAAFSRSPSRFLSGTTAEAFLAELLRELRDDRATSSVKVLLLSPLCEEPTLLCPSASVGEETALELMSVLAQCPPRSVQLRSRLLLALTSVLVCTSCASDASQASQDFLELLLQMCQDTSDLHGDGALCSVRVTACDCLRELEACCPSLLSQRLELLMGLWQRESSRLHQAYAGLQALVLRNCVQQLAQEPGAGAEHLRALLGGNTPVAWEADQNTAQSGKEGSALLSSLVLGPMGSVPILQTGPDCKELRLVLSSLLEESYLLTPLCQAALLHKVIEVVAMVPGVPPSIFRAQLLRLLGTSEVCLLHSTLLMKCAFTDSLFSAEDEAFILKQLVARAQHPLLATPEKLFYMHCILHFPENRPIDCGDGDEALPVLLTPRLASALLPTVFNDSATMLARLHLLSLLYLEEGEGEGEEGGRGLAYLYEHMVSLLHIVESGGGREIVVTFFRAAYLFLLHFCHVEEYSDGTVDKLCRLYRRHPHLAPHIINLADQIQEQLSHGAWAVRLLGALQGVITEAPPSRPQSLRWHLKTLARVAAEGEIAQHGALDFLSGVITAPPSSPLCLGGDWRLGKAVLAVCRRLLVHPALDALLVPLADVLQRLALGYGDTDVQDHARLYNALLTTLSGEKLAAVLAQGAGPGPGPGAGPGEGGRQVKLRSLSSIMAESEGLTSMLSVHQTERPVLRLLPLQSAAQHPHPEGELDPGHALEALEAYRAQFSDPAFASEVTLKYQLLHAEDQRLPAFDRLYSIRLHFSLTDGSYEELSDISVPCLFRERPPPSVRLRLRPRRHLPTTLRAAAVFSTHDGLCWHSPLPDIYVAFRQILAPLPWAAGGRLRVFQALWEELTREAPGDGATSLFCCQLEAPQLEALLQKHLAPFLVSDPSHGHDFKVLFFLAPSSHVLLKIRSEEDAVLFDIATDNWRLLPHINSFLIACTSSQDKTHS